MPHLIGIVQRVPSSPKSLNLGMAEIGAITWQRWAMMYSVQIRALYGIILKMLNYFLKLWMRKYGRAKPIIPATVATRRFLANGKSPMFDSNVMKKKITPIASDM